MFQAPTWLPYKVRTRVDQWRILNAVAALDRTKPYPVNKPDNADGEIHMLLCRRDVKLGVLAMKSLLRFKELRLAGTVTDDGSITPDQRKYVDHHVPGLRWLKWKQPEENIAKALSTRPALSDLYYKSTYEQIAKLVHPIVIPQAPRQIQMDSDTAFFQVPDTFVRFMKGDDKSPWYLHDHQDEKVAVPKEAQEAFAVFEKHALKPGKTWGLQHRFFNAGLLVYRPEHLKLDDAETYLAWRLAAPEKFTTGKAGIWFGKWTPEQTAYHVMYALTEPPPRPMGDDYHLGGQLGHTFNHFLRHYVVQAPVLNALRKLITEL